MNIGIIGAGVTGLVTAKVLLARGHSVTLFEQRPELGGVWEVSRRYIGLKIQSPREIYTFSDFDMPADYPEFPEGRQIASYLDAYAEKYSLNPHVRFNTQVLSLRKAGAGWRLELKDMASGRALPDETFEHVVLCNGLFTKRNAPELAGRPQFEAAGGRVLHSVEFTDLNAASGKDVIVVGFGKSALDVAYEARKVARRVTLLFRRTTWHVPYKLFGVIPGKALAYSRSAEFWHGRNASGLEGFLHKRLPWLVRLYWAVSGLVIGAHLGLLSKKMRPDFSLRDSIGLATGFGFKDNLRKLRNGEIDAVKGEIASLDADGATLADGRRIAAQLVILATGFEQDLSILSDEDRAKVLAPNGDYRLYRHIVAPALEGLTFNGYNGTTAVPLTSEISAHWIARWIDGQVKHPNAAEMNAAIDEDLAWRRAHQKASHPLGHFAGPLTFYYLDTLLADMGLPPADAKHPPFSRFNAILNPQDYAFLSTL
ncbi:MAG: FAD-dependent oxidoreductase [Alphaproteobacteria bacterium]|nr:FAD-dependent oxidoreductase [Alphaproteobacteria bacterium]